MAEGRVERQARVSPSALYDILRQRLRRPTRPTSSSTSLVFPMLRPATRTTAGSALETRSRACACVREHLPLGVKTILGVSERLVRPPVPPDAQVAERGVPVPLHSRRASTSAIVHAGREARTLRTRSRRRGARSSCEDVLFRTVRTDDYVAASTSSWNTSRASTPPGRIKAARNVLDALARRAPRVAYILDRRRSRRARRRTSTSRRWPTTPRSTIINSDLADGRHGRVVGRPVRATTSCIVAEVLQSAEDDEGRRSRTSSRTWRRVDASRRAARSSSRP